MPTWTRDGAGSIAIGIGENRVWRDRTLILIAPELAFPGICSVVEANIPHTVYKPRRAIGGCFGRDAKGRLWLLHRGARFTASGGVIKKAEIHETFDADLIDAEDGGQSSSLIPIACVASKSLVVQIRGFAVRVQTLKREYASDG